MFAIASRERQTHCPACLAIIAPGRFSPSMTSYDRRTRLVAACLAAVAGYVDAVGYIMTDGFVVSFMSGNTTRLGLALAEAPRGAVTAASLVAAFVSGVVAGSLLGRAAGQRRLAAVLGLMAGLLAASALLHSIGWEGPAVALLGLAMGAENTVFVRDGEVWVGLTYMTGAIVKAGQRLAAALTVGDPLSFAPHLLPWVSMAGGAGLGAVLHACYGTGALWAATAVVVLLAAVSLTHRDEDT